MPNIDDFFSDDSSAIETRAEAAPVDSGASQIDAFFSEEPSGEQAVSGTPAQPDTGLLQTIASDFAEGATAPFVGAWHAGRALLAEPQIGMLPMAGQDLDLKKAEELGWKGAAFWASLYAGGVGANLGRGLLAKAALGGGAGGATYELAKQLPDLMSGETSFEEASKDIGTTAAFSALTGGVLSKVPAAIGLSAKAAGATGRFAGRTAMNAANFALDRIPGGPQARDSAQQFIRRAYTNLWDRAFTSGQELLRKVGLDPLRVQLAIARSTAALIGGKYVSAMQRNLKGLTDDEVSQVAKLIEGGAGADAPGNSGVSEKVRSVAVAEAARLREMGELLQKAGVQIYDPESGFHSFVLRNNYIPHRFVDAEQYMVDGPLRDQTIAQVQKKLQFTRERAESWVNDFAKRIRAEQEGILADRPVSLGTAHFLQGRTLELPGYETDLRKILPQYYEYAARRLANHTMFGVVHPVQQAVKEAGEQLSLFPGEPRQIAQEAAPAAKQLFLEGLESFRGQGIPKEEIRRKLSERQVVRAREARAIKELRRSRAVEQRYPRAFAQLEAIEDPAQKEIARRIVSRQLGAIDEDQFSRGVLPVLAKVEVISKLALGAIAQPSQMMSAVVRTGYKGAARNFWRVISGDPEALDFGLRTGAILRGVVRHSEQSLTGQAGQDFLEKVYFTQMDLKSRVFGALQGASFAQFQAKKLGELAALPATRANLGRMARIESKLVDIGLDPKAILERGGDLTEDELLLAGQKIASEVNFWGDSLSLPEFFRSPMGRYVTMFKSFGFQQGKLFKDKIIKPAMEWYRSDGKRGDIMPLVRFATLTPAGGEIITDLKKTARAKSRQDSNFAERVMENIANGAGFGLMYDAFEATKYGIGGVLGWGAGPIGAEMGRGAANVGSALRGNPKQLAKQLIETGIPAGLAAVRSPLTPLAAAVAPAISNVLLPPKER